ncbi:ABC transporter substrate-binding protein [Pseudoroseomonas globiformis]|uniref:ABC transporter substrate-binding protein n=1 Tax=Teichococcus globiformis TaxID=2307229 RepID=A0ABV7G2N7_9PROT
MRRKALLLLGLSLLAAPLAPAMAEPAGKLVLYTSQLEPDAARTVQLFQGKHPKVQVEWIRGGTNQIMPRLRAEIAAGNPRADLLLLADSLTFEGLKKEGLLRSSPDVATGNTPDTVHDPERTYFGTKLLTTGIVMNTRAPFTPKGWGDLLRPEAANLTAMPSPSVSGAAAIHVQTVAQAPGLGWDYWEKLLKAGVQPRGGNGAVMQAVAGGERAFGIVVDYMPIREAAKGAPVQFIFPADGASAITEPVAILKSSRNPEAAAAFVSFLLSREGQELASSQGFLPADPEVAPPAGFPDRRGINLLPFDAARAVAEGEQDLKRFNQLAGQ